MPCSLVCRLASLQDEQRVCREAALVRLVHHNNAVRTHSAALYTIQAGLERTREMAEAQLCVRTKAHSVTFAKQKQCAALVNANTHAQHELS